MSISINKYLLITSMFLSASACAEIEAVYEAEKYVAIDMVAVCSDEGQVKLIYTNVSGEHLLVNPDYVEQELFDPAALGVSLNTESYTQIPLKHLKPKVSHGPIERYAPLSPGQVVEHLIDFNDYHEGELDYSQRYIVMFSFSGKLITESGNIKIVSDSSPFLMKNHIIEPSCWQE